jgi:hypothetical protein
MAFDQKLIRLRRKQKRKDKKELFVAISVRTRRKIPLLLLDWFEMQINFSVCLFADLNAATARLRDVSLEIKTVNHGAAASRRFICSAACVELCKTTGWVKKWINDSSLT